MMYQVIVLLWLDVVTIVVVRAAFVLIHVGLVDAFVVLLCELVVVMRVIMVLAFKCCVLLLLLLLKVVVRRRLPPALVRNSPLLQAILARGDVLVRKEERLGTEVSTVHEDVVGGHVQRVGQGKIAPHEVGVDIREHGHEPVDPFLGRVVQVPLRRAQG